MRRTHWAMICRWSSSERLESARQTATPSSAVWAVGSSCRVASEAMLSVQRTTGESRKIMVSFDS